MMRLLADPLLSERSCYLGSSSSNINTPNKSLSGAVHTETAGLRPGLVNHRPGLVKQKAPPPEALGDSQLNSFFLRLQLF